MLKEKGPETRKRCPVNLQLPPELYSKLRSYAMGNDHTINWQTNIILRDFFQQKETQEAK